MLYMATFTIHIPQMLAYIPYMDPMGMNFGDSTANVSNLQAFYVCRAVDGLKEMTFCW